MDQSEQLAELDYLLSIFNNTDRYNLISLFKLLHSSKNID